MAKELGSDGKVSVVDPTGMHHHQPGHVYVALGQANGRWLVRDDRALLRRGFDLVIERAIRVHPEAPPTPNSLCHAAKWMFNRYGETVPEGRLPDDLPMPIPTGRSES